MKTRNTRRGFTQIKNSVIPNLIWNLQRLPLQLINDLRGRYPAGRPIKYGMTPLCNNGAFTLIELLVVVLIIGILAAVAVPQYQKAVLKARFAEAFNNLKTMAQAQQACQLEKGDVCSFDELSIDIGTADNFWDNQTNDFVYFTANGTYTDTFGNALYKKEDICLCYTQDGEIVFSNEYEHGGCVDKEASLDYGKLLNIREVSYDECGCC